MAKIPVTDFKAGIDQAETEATRHATELANKEYQIEYQVVYGGNKIKVKTQGTSNKDKNNGWPERASRDVSTCA